jgi:hypothetical protein
MSSLISNGYIPCEYIESSGTQYIDTGFTPTSKTKVIYDFAYTSLVSQYSGIYVDGARLLFGLNTRLEVYLGSTTNTSLTATTNRQTIVFDIPNKTALVNGTTVLQNISYTPKAYTLHIFAMRYGSGISNYSYFKLYSCQIYDDNVLIMDFKPCRNTNGVYGLFDEVNNVFYTTPTGAFTGKAIYSGIQFNRSFRRRMLTYQPHTDFASQYFTIKAIENGTLSFSKHGTGDDIKYSKDNGNTWTILTSGETIGVNAGDKVLWKSSITPNTSYSDGYGIGRFSSSNKFNVCGNIMSLLYGDGFVGKNTLYARDFTGLFSQSLVVDASNLILPATTLSNFCYAEMFRNCTSLTTAPELPATTLYFGCYSSMFYGCTNLTTAPELPATTMTQSCYSSMFYGCTSLTTAPELPATTMVQSCYYGMFYGCTSLTTAPELPATTLAQSCYDNMFADCTNLTTAPELPATTLATRCYQFMFNNCTSLNYIKMLATDISAFRCLYNWVGGVASTGIFVKHPDMGALPSGINGIPNGWTVKNSDGSPVTGGGSSSG